MQNPIKQVQNSVQNYFVNRRYRETSRREFMAELVERQIRYGFNEAVQIVEPGKRKYLDRNTTSYFELEHKYGTHVWVYVAVNIIAEKSSVPDLVLQDAEDKRIENVNILPLRPNSIQTWNECEQLISVWLELTGNAYIYHDMEDDTYWPLRPSRMKVVVGDDNRSIKGYAYNRHHNSSTTSDSQIDPIKNWMYDDPEVLEVTPKEWNARLRANDERVHKGMMPIQMMERKEEWVPLESYEVLHFRYASPTSDVYGMSPLHPLFANLESDLYARQWNKSFFENGAMPPGVLVIPTTFKEKEFESVRKKFYDQFGGPKNRGKPFVLQGGGEGANYVPFPSQHRDLEFLELLNWSRDEVLAVFGVPHVMANAQLTGSHSSALSPGIRELRKIFWQDTMFPKMQMRAEVWNNHFGYDMKGSPKLGYDYSMIQDLRPDYFELSKAAAIGLKAGMTLQEVRTEILGLSEDWGDDDLFFTK